MSGGERPSIGAVWRNFRQYDAPVATKARMFARNTWRKAKTKSDCCGNHGEPGCCIDSVPPGEH